VSRLQSLFGARLVITDGGWGTEFQKRGLKVGRASDIWNRTHPGDVEAVASAYVQAGSQVILTNTFRSNPVALAATGAAEHAAAINRRGVELSKRAAGSSARVFASMGPTGKLLAAGDIDEKTVMAAFQIQAQAVAEAGADALLFETFSDLDEARLAVQAARPLGLPIVVSFSFDSGKNKDRTMTGATPESAARAMAELEVDAVGANCGAGPEFFPALCRRLKQSSRLPVWIKPNAGLPTLAKGRAVYAMDPDSFSSYLPALIEAGATFVGGCCGTSPDFIRALVKAARACESS
jgi:methionine synthase I (cobalamin-dependent)